MPSDVVRSPRAVFWDWLQQDLSLTPIETRIMHAFGRHFGYWLSKTQLVELVYRDTARAELFTSDWGSLRTHIYRIRPKLSPTPWRIENRYKHGLYRLVHLTS